MKGRRTRCKKTARGRKQQREWKGGSIRAGRGECARNNVMKRE